MGQSSLVIKQLDLGKHSNLQENVYYVFYLRTCLFPKLNMSYWSYSHLSKVGVSLGNFGTRYESG